MYLVMKKFMGYWSTLQGSNKQIDKKALLEIFHQIDYDGDGEITLLEYKKVLREKPGLFSWSDILNGRTLIKNNDLAEKIKEIEQKQLEQQVQTA